MAYGPMGLRARMMPTPEMKAARSKQLVVFDVREAALWTLGEGGGGGEGKARSALY